MSILDGLMQYDLQCELFEKLTGKIIQRFNAREVDALDVRSSPAMGGIASLGQNYTIATKEDVKIIPNTHKIKIDGIVYMVVGVKSYSKKMPYGRTLNLSQKKEEWIFLR